jgi:hypothetical protein
MSGWHIVVIAESVIVAIVAVITLIALRAHLALGIVPWPIAARCAPAASTGAVRRSPTLATALAAEQWRPRIIQRVGVVVVGIVIVTTIFQRA